MWRRTFLVTLLSGAIAFAQSVTGTITGTVLDSSNLPVSGVKVQLVQAATGLERESSTDIRGDFVFSSVAPAVSQAARTRTRFPLIFLQWNSN